MRVNASLKNPAAITTYTAKQIYEYCREIDPVKMQLPSAASAFFWKNMNRYYLTSTVWREGTIGWLPSKPMTAIGEIKIQTKKHGKLTLNEYIAQASIDALIVVHRGTILYERYQGMRPFDKHWWASVSKTIVGTSVGLLEAEGKIDVRQPIETYLPEFVGCDWQGTPIIDILDMATGLDSTEHDEPTPPRLNPDSGWFRWAASLGIFPNVQQRNETLWQVLRAMKRVKPSGTAYEYNSINTFVLERLVERVTNQPINEFISDRIWRKIGAEADATLVISKDGYSLGFFGMSSTLRDIARYGMLFTPSWNKVSRERIIPQSYLNKIQKGGRSEMFDRGKIGKLSIEYLEALNERPLFNTYQWDWVMPDGDFFKSGVGGQGLYVSPGRDLVIAYFHSDEHAGEEAIARTIVKSILF